MNIRVSWISSFSFFRNANRNDILSKERRRRSWFRPYRSNEDSNEVRYRGIRNSIERYPPRGKINKTKDACSGLRRGKSDGGEIRGSGRRAKIKKRRREERRGRKPDELSSPRASVEDTRGESASKLLLIIARTTRLLSLSLSVCVSLLFPSSSSSFSL